jgi:catechol 2,3-dioxygenase-like lactoylglutathione lyase family enzyme
MRISSSAISLIVDDIAASSSFLISHFGFREAMAAEGFVSLEHDHVGTGIVFLQHGLEWLPGGLKDSNVAGVIISFIVSDLAAEEARLRSEGVEITIPTWEQPWGERLFRMTDPNGIAIEVVEWSAPSTTKG